MSMFRIAAGAALAAACAFSLVACGSSNDAKPGAETVQVGISDAGCSPAVLELTAGPKVFVIKSSGSGKVTEYEILKGKRVIGEREGLAPGIDGKLSMDLPAGEYVSYCPGGKTDRGKVIVRAASGASGSTPEPTADTEPGATD